MKGFDTFFDYYLHIRKAREEEEDISPLQVNINVIICYLFIYFMCLVSFIYLFIYSFIYLFIYFILETLSAVVHRLEFKKGINK